MKIISIEDNTNPKFIKTKKVVFEKDGKTMKWEIIEKHDSVHILVNNIETKEIFMVQQVRIPVFLKDTSLNGVMTEMCAGLVDKNKDLIEIAKEEVLEELGYNVDISNIKFLKTIKSSVGSSGNNANLFYVEINETQKVSNGGGIQLEDITILKIPYSKIDDFINNDKNYHFDAVSLYLLEISKKYI